MKRGPGRPEGSRTKREPGLNVVLSYRYAWAKAALAFGEACRATRESMEISAASLARATGVTEPTILKYERGAGAPSLATALRISWALGVSLASLLEGA